MTPSAVAPLLRQQNPPAPSAPPAPKNPPPAAPASQNKQSSFDFRTLGLLPGGLIAALVGPGGRAVVCSGRAAQNFTGGGPADAPPAPPKTKSAPPVLMAVSGDQIIIASQDREALDQMESLLRMMARQTGGPGRNYNVYLLKHAVATKVAETLQQLFRPAPQSGYVRRSIRSPLWPMNE